MGGLPPPPGLATLRSGRGGWVTCRWPLALGMQLSRACWLTFTQILTRRLSWGCEASRGRKRLPARLPQLGRWSEGPSSGLFQHRREMAPHGPNEERKRALLARGKWSQSRAQALHHPVPTAHASDCLQAVLVPPESAWTLPAPGKFPPFPLLWADQGVS